MGKKILALIGLLFILLSVSKVNAQWVQIGPSGGFINKFFASGDKIYAAAYGGVLVSTDAGLSWSHSDLGFTDGDVQSVVATSKKVYAGTYSGGVFMRDINGLIWESTSLKDQTISCLAAIGDNVFAGTYSTGVWLSTDDGTTWNKVNNGLSSLQVNCLAVSGSNIFCGINEDGGVYLSTNNGTNWTLANTGLPNSTPISLAVNGTDVYAGFWTSGPGVYVSPNNGQGWMQLGQCPVGYVGSITFNGTEVFVAGQKVGVTTNGGVDWKDISTYNTEGLPWTNIQALCYTKGNLIAGDNAVNISTGIYISNNEGANWSQANVGVPNYCINSIAANNGYILDATSGGVFYSTDDGTEWEEPTMHGEYRWADFSAISFRNSNYVFAGDVNGHVYVSTDGGKELTLQTQIEQGASVTSFAFISTFAFAATKPYESGVAGGVYKSLDNGITWTLVNNGLPTPADTNTYVTSLAVIGNNLFAGTGHGVYLSTDYGDNWTKVNNGLTGKLVYALAVKSNELFAGTYNEGVFRSNNNGTTWTHTSLITDVTALTVVDTNLFAGTWSKGIYRLVNWDSTWVPVGLPNVYVTSFAASNGYLYAATNNNSVWRRPISEITDVKKTNGKIPTDFSLAQNYPNPFNPSTIIEYTLSDRQFVTLKVFDILGREIKTLVNEEKPAGLYTVMFDADGLSSGIYFYKIQAGKFSETRKMVLLR